MTPRFSTSLRVGTACLIAAVWQLGNLPAASAQQPPPAAAPEEAPKPSPMATPAMTGPLVANPNPMYLDITPFFGPMYVTGAVTGFGMAQTDPILGLDRRWNFDVSNAQATLQTTEGMFQFFLEPGIYALPTLGLPYKRVTDMPTSTRLFGGLPVAWGKVVFNDNFSIQGGKLPTIMGAEYMFTFQNMNIERGLLWAQENVINRGVQANLTTGPVAWSLSLNDGFYTGEYNYMIGSAAWTINPTNSVVVMGGGPFDRVTATNTPVGPQYNNSMMFMLGYTYNDAPWTITPYVQYTHVDRDTGLSLVDSSTIGGAILASYKFNDYISLAGRWEYIDSSGAATVGGAGLLGYGPGSSAM
ncbi:MAG TPA: outer membrane beta-barrel protein, partial [Stellaceae bacterium]|nr:outer membrane beta-barrel protein [Stellaceae bacterium]